MTGPYDDIINLPHHVSATRPQMPRENRAAQFSPFAALTGHNDAILETARLTDRKIELNEDSIATLNLKLRVLADKVNEHPEISVTHFQPDELKDGGAYVTTIGKVKKIDDYECAIILMSGESVPYADILDIECHLFKGLA